MAIELRQSMKMTQQLVMTPQLQQTIKLLQLSRMELIDTIQEELEKNPLLEDSFGDAEESARDADSEELTTEDFVPSGDSPFPIEELEAPSGTQEEPPPMRDDFNWEAFVADSPPRIPYETEVRDTPSFENFVSAEEGLTDHLIWQLRMSDLSDDQKLIGMEIIGNLDDNGYLGMSVEEVAASTGKTPEEVGVVLSRIQEFDPPGVAARDLRECLLIQLRALEIDNPIVIALVSEHLGDLGKKSYAALSKKLDCSMEDIHEAVNVIVHLEPKPGSIFHKELPAYITPDVYIYKETDGFAIALNEDGLPRLRVNNFYKEAINGSRYVASETKAYIQDRLRSAVWLIKSIHQRQRTIYKVAESILRFQREFFEKGISHLKPLILKDVADDINMHESTISRVTSNKYVHTPQGIYGLKFFFNSAIGRSDGDSIASESVKAKIRQIIQSEDRSRPYSDNKIVDLLEEEGITIARRTVAKYREMMKILPSSKRKDPFSKGHRKSKKSGT